MYHPYPQRLACSQLDRVRKCLLMQLHKVLLWFYMQVLLALRKESVPCFWLSIGSSEIYRLAVHNKVGLPASMSVRSRTRPANL